MNPILRSSQGLLAEYVYLIVMHNILEIFILDYHYFGRLFQTSPQSIFFL